jgi:serine/threonine protein kinase
MRGMTKQRRARLVKSQSVMRPQASEPPAASGQSRTSEVSRPSSGFDALGRKQCPSCGERYPASFRVCPRDAIELQDDVGEEDPLLGTCLADTYELMRVIGEGAAGRVYEARHTRLFSKRFAIKVLHGDLIRQTEVVRRFVREAESTSALQHPNIMGVLDINTVPDGRPYIVAELLQGEQLGDCLDREGKLSVADSVSICRQISRALIGAHDKHIIHRDIKPENVFLVGKGRRRTVKVLDFGISKVTNAAGNLTKTGMVMGTPAYMPPEQARGAKVDHRADVYAVGVILYEAVTGKRPFDGDDPFGTLAAVLTSDPPRPRTIDPSIPSALELVIQKAMAKQPNERFQTMRELDHALSEFDSLAEEGNTTGARNGDADGRDDEDCSRDTASFGISTLPLPKNASRFTKWLHAWAGEDAPPQQVRLRLAGVSLAAVGCGFAVLADLITSTLRALRPGVPLSDLELSLAAIASGSIVLAASMAWLRHLLGSVWSSTPRVIQVLRRTTRALTAGLVTYALILLSVRVFDGAFRSDPNGVGWPGWAIVASAAMVLAGGAMSWISQRLRKSVQ